MEPPDQHVRANAERDGNTIIGAALEAVEGPSDPFKRPALRPWLTEPARIASYDTIAAAKVDRLSRSQWHAIRLRKWCEEHGKRLVISTPSLTWPCEPADAGMRMLWSFLESQAEAERHDTSQRYRRLQENLRSQGSPAGRPPFGYAVVQAEGGRKTLAPTETGRQYIPQIFQRVLTGDPLSDIARWLEAEGVASGGTSGWWPRTLSEFITNSVYMGRRYDSQGRTILRCEPLVDPRTFRLAGKALKRRPKRGPVRAGNRAMLAGALFCRRCEDSPMYRIKVRAAREHGGTLTYYRCSGRGARRQGCGNMVRVETVDAAVNKMAAAIFRQHVIERRLVPGQDHSAALEEIRYEIQQLAMKNLADEEYDAELRKLRAERDRLAALPAIPDSVEYVETGQTYAELWEDVQPSQRGPWLTEHGFKVTADKSAVELVTPEWFPWPGAALEAHVRNLPPRNIAVDLVVAGVVVKERRDLDAASSSRCHPA